MRCQQLRERLLREGRFVRPGTPEERTHIGSCTACGEWLTAERLLSASLSQMGRELAEQSPGPRVEAALLASFRTLRRAETPKARPVRLQRLWLFVPVSVAAATILIPMALHVPPAPVHPRETAAATPTLRQQPVAIAQEPSSPPPLRRVENSARPPRPRPTAPPHAPEAPPALDPSEPQMEIEELGPLAPGIIVLADPPGSAFDAEFVPLGPADTPVLLEGGQVLRVELSPERARSAGLPVDSRSGPASIRADVVVGHDGVARAIRLVRDR